MAVKQRWAIFVSQEPDARATMLILGEEAMAEANTPEGGVHREVPTETVWLEQVPALGELDA